MKEKKNLITNYITQEECNYLSDDTLFNCESCSNINECFEKANDKCNSEFAENINYGGYNTEEKFWEQLFN